MSTMSAQRLLDTGRLAAFGSAVALLGLLTACAPASTPNGRRAQQAGRRDQRRPARQRQRRPSRATARRTR